MGLDIARFKEKGKSGKWSLALGVAVNLLILGFFKYYGFLAENLEALLPVKLPELAPRLPIGLSFYTFQSISYLADVYRGKAKRQTNLISFGLYISMFPQLVAGPIVQYADVDAQLQKAGNVPGEVWKRSPVFYKRPFEEGASGQQSGRYISGNYGPFRPVGTVSLAWRAGLYSSDLF